MSTRRHHDLFKYIIKDNHYIKMSEFIHFNNNKSKIKERLCDSNP